MVRSPHCKIISHKIPVVRCIAPMLAIFLITSSTFAQPQKPATSHVIKRAEVERVFQLGGCGGCHVIPGVKGADGDVGPDLSKLGQFAKSRRSGMSATDYIRESLIDPDAFISPDGTEETYPAGVMQSAFEDSLTKSDVDLVVNYLSKLGTDQQPKWPNEPQSTPLSRELPVESILEPFTPLTIDKPDAKRIALGRALFFDRRLSSNNSRSCASCHQPDKAFSDGEKLSAGYPSTKLFRNTPTLMNISFQNDYFRDGRIGDLPSTVRDHLTEAHFMAIDGRLMVERLKQIPEYVDFFKEVDGAPPSFGKTLNALSAYVLSLNSSKTAFDRFQNGDQSALSADAVAGWKLFNGKANCTQCHSGTHFNDGKFHHLDVPEDETALHDPERHVTFRRFFRILGTPNYTKLTTDPGRYAVTLNSKEKGAFRTPSLREVERTAPYMHNGELATLEDVVHFYNNGGGKNQTAGLKPLELTNQEMAQLVAFLKSLSSKATPIEAPTLPDYELFDIDLAITKSSANSATQPIQESQRDAIRNAIANAPPLGVLPLPPAPLDNPATAGKLTLGRMLFFDPRLSADGSTSCHSCHASTTGGTIRTPISIGSPGTSHWRNSQSVFNVAYFAKLNWDGAKSSIESQNHGAWTGAVAGNLDPILGEERLAHITEYSARFREEFGTDAPRWDDALRAVASFQRTLVSENVPVDQWIAFKRELPEAAIRGSKLFTGKANCIACHNGPLLSDGSYHNIGLTQDPEFMLSPLKQITFRYELASKGVPASEYNTATIDEGLYYVTKRNVDRGKFRTPSLRELTHTAPYMHNGSLDTLQEVVAFYNAGGGLHSNRSQLIVPLGLSVQEQADLVAFLEALSGDPLDLKRPKLPPYDNYPLLKTEQ